MTCQNCARHVTEAIQGVAGVRSASVSLEAGRATVRWDANAPANVPAVLSAVAGAGYEARPVEGGAHDHGGRRQSRWQWNLILGLAVTWQVPRNSVGLLLAGCSDDGGSDTLTEGELARILRDDYDVPAEQADCVAGQAFARLTSDELAVLQDREDDDEVPVELQRKLRAAVTPDLPFPLV